MEISTTARRITRDLNQTSCLVTVLYDKNGEVVASHEADMYYLPGKRPSEAIYEFTGRRDSRWGKATYREIQAEMNEGVDIK